MSFLKTCALVLLAVHLVFSQDEIPTDDMSDRSYFANSTAVTRQQQPPPDPCPVDGLICTDCYTFRLCVNFQNTLISAGVFSCSATHPATPYCYNGRCTSLRPPGCNERTCTQSGHFPDPDDCRKYFRCINRESFEYECPRGEVYAYNTDSCVTRRRNTDCVEIKCPLEPGLHYVAYPRNANVYAVCVKGLRTTMYKCLPGETFNEATRQCQA